MARRFLILFAALALAGCFRKCGSRWTPPVASSTAPSVVPVPAIVPRVEIAAGVDVAPAHLDAPAASLKAAPAWASRGYAPQGPWATRKALFQSADSSKRQAGVIDDALVICQALYSGRPDAVPFYEAPDLDIEFDLGAMPHVTTSAPEDTHDAYVAFPLAHLGARDRVSAHLWDRDATTRDDLGVVAGAYGGTLPLVVERGARRVECRVLARAEVEARFVERLHVADAELDRIAPDVAIQPRAWDFGKRARTGTAKNDVADLAALVGWADARVARRVDWLARIGARFDELVAEYVRVEAPKTPATTSWAVHETELAARVLGVECGATKKYEKIDRIRVGLVKTKDLLASGCLLRIEFANVGEQDHTMSLWGMSVGTFVDIGLALGGGGVVAAKLIEVEGPDVRDAQGDRIVPPGKRGTAVLALMGAVDPSGANAARAPKLVNIEWPFASGPILMSVP